MKRGQAIALTLIGVVLVATGCGGSTKSKPVTRGELIAKANPVCKQIKQEIVYYSNLRPSNSKDLLNKRAISQAAPRIASLERAAGIKLEKLTPPDSMSDDWKQIVDGLQTLASDTQQLANAIVTRDRATSTEISTAAAGVLQRINTAAARNGFNDCVNLIS